LVMARSPKVSFWPDGSTSSGNYGYILIYSLTYICLNCLQCMWCFLRSHYFSFSRIWER
jgi:hypothetical protein